MSEHHHDTGMTAMEHATREADAFERRQDFNHYGREISRIARQMLEVPNFGNSGLAINVEGDKTFQKLELEDGVTLYSRTEGLFPEYAILIDGKGYMVEMNPDNTVRRLVKNWSLSSNGRPLRPASMEGSELDELMQTVQRARSAKPAE